MNLNLYKMNLNLYKANLNYVREENVLDIVTLLKFGLLNEYVNE